MFVCSTRQSVSKLLTKFPLNDNTLSDLSFINPTNRAKDTPRGIIRLCKRLMTDKPEEIGTVVAEYRAFSVAADDQLPSYDSKADNALETFWSAMSQQKTVASHLELTSCYSYFNLARLAKILLVFKC